MASIVIGDYTYNTNGSVSVVDKTKQSYGSILSSFEYDGQTYDVTDMSYCFYECVNLINAPTIPESITNMSSCFEECVSLVKTPTIPTSVEDLSYCFCRCTGLKYADDFPLTTTPVLKNMAGCFAYCTSLTKAPRQIPRSVTRLASCFLNCKSLKRSPQSIYSIVSSGTDSLDMAFCFVRCESLETSPALPDKVTNLSNCFDGCINLTNVSRLPKNVTDVSSCFSGCRSLQGNIEVQNIPEYSGDIFADLSNQNIYIINTASSEIKEDVAEEWRSIANQYRSVHYEADDHSAPIITLSAKRSNNDGESSSTGKYITVTKQYNYNLDNLPVDWDITLTESMKLDSVLITPASSEPGESITFTIPQEVDELSHTIIYTVNDGYKTTVQTVEISKVIALLDFFGNPSNKIYPNDKPGMGMAIGNIAKRNGLDIQFPTTIGEGLIPPQKNGGVDLGNYQLIIGKYNDTDSQYNDDLFVIGNGTSSTDRKNTFTIDQNGYMNVVNDFEIKVQDKALMTLGNDSVIIGKKQENHTIIDYHSLQLIDEKKNVYFHASDLRDLSGEAKVSTTFRMSEKYGKYTPPLAGWIGWGGELSYNNTSWEEYFKIYNNFGRYFCGNDTYYLTEIPILSDYDSSLHTASKMRLVFNIAFTDIKYVEIKFKYWEYIQTGPNTWGTVTREVIAGNYTTIGSSEIEISFETIDLGKVDPGTGRQVNTVNMSYVAFKANEEIESYIYCVVFNKNENKVFVHCHFDSYQHNIPIDAPQLERLLGVTIEYKTDSITAKALTFGSRIQYIIGPFSSSFGIDNSPSGFASSSFGEKSSAYGYAALSEGSGNAIGSFSHAEGCDTYAAGDYSHVEGYNTVTDGDYSHAEGYKTYAMGDYSHAEGCDTYARGNYSHAEGYDIIADGDYSHAQNIATTTSRQAQTAIGKYNKNRTNTAFEIGNGTAYNARSNALTIDWNGNIVTKDLELTRGTIPASSNYRDKIVFTDSNDATLGYIRTPFLTDGREGIQIETTRTVNGSAIYNGIQMYINASGTPSVTLNHPAAWRTALGLEPFTPSISITSTTGTLNSYVIRQMGKLVSLTLYVYNTSSVASASNIYQGTINTEALRPIAYTTNATFMGARLFGGSINMAGTIALRNTSTSAVTTSSSNMATISFVYFVK